MPRQRPGFGRRLSTEKLESRRMMAGDACEFSMPFSEIDTSVPLTGSDNETLSAAGFVGALDAGSTRSTAADIGSVEGTRTLSGSLGWFDRSDKIRFQLDRPGQFQAVLSGLDRDADLYLTDAEGNLVDHSTRFGRSVDRVVANLPAGEYFLTVVAVSWWNNRYRLTLNANLQPAPPPVPAPEAEQPESTPPTDTPPESPVPSPTVDPPNDNVAPLADVAYFGGNRDWNLNAVGAPEAWAAGYTGEGVTVAVVDTGVDLDHPDLISNLYVNPGEIPGNGIDDDQNGYVDDVHGYDFADRDARPDDVGGHGTHVAGTIAASNNGFGATGVAPDATILPVRVLGANGSGSTIDVAAGIRYAADMGADIINLSLGGGYSRAIEAAIDYARSLGSFIVAAAGNESASVPGFPARFSASDSNVISVGAHDSNGRVAGFSNDVGTSGSVQVDAPGVNVFSTYVGGRYANLSGTSMAAPHVAGLAALTLSADPNLTTSELRDLLSSGTVGSALGSDGIGQASALQSVAYAAAGQSIQGTTNSANSAGSASSSITTRRAVATGVARPVDRVSPPLARISQSSELVSIETSESDRLGFEFVLNPTFHSSGNTVTVSHDSSDTPTPSHDPESAVDRLFANSSFVPFLNDPFDMDEIITTHRDDVV